MSDLHEIILELEDRIEELEKRFTKIENHTGLPKRKRQGSPYDAGRLRLGPGSNRSNKC